MQSGLHAVLDDAEEEDSVFVSLADLFSLLSLTIIYVVLTFGQTVPAASTEPVVAATLEGSGPGKPINPQDTYVSIQSRGASVLFRVARNGLEFDQEAIADGASLKIPAQWLLGALGTDAANGTIYLYLPPSEKSVVVEALFTDTARLLRSRFTNVSVAL
jgi:hypothetical protein